MGFKGCENMEDLSAILVDVVLGNPPNYESKEDIDYYYKLKKELEETESKYGRKMMIEIPDD